MLAVHTASNPLQFSVPVQRQIASLDPGLPVSDVLTMNEVIGESLVNACLSATLVLAFAILSLLLASVGLYGSVLPDHAAAFGTGNPHGALRATRSAFAVDAGRWPAAGVFGLGLVVSFAATRIFQSMIFGPSLSIL